MGGFSEDEWEALRSILRELHETQGRFDETDVGAVVLSRTLFGAGAGSLAARGVSAVVGDMERLGHIRPVDGTLWECA